MTDKDKQIFGETLAILFETLGFQLSEAQMAGFWLALRDMPLPAFQKAATRALRELTFTPKPADLLRLAACQRPSNEELASLAWSAVVEAMKRHSNQSVDFQDGGMTNAAVRAIGGWVWLTSLPSREVHAFQSKRFMEAYRALLSAGRVSPEAGGRLIGASEQDCDPRWLPDFAKRNPTIRVDMPFDAGVLALPSASQEVAALGRA